MLVKLKFRMYAGGQVYEQGVQEIPDGTPLPSTAVRLEPDFVPEPEVEKPAAPDTLSGMLPKTAMEKAK